MIVCLVLVMGSCARRPEGVLSSREMVNVLVDIHRVDGLIQLKGWQYGHVEEVDALYQQVLQKHGLDQARFDSSLVWYTDHPVYFNRIYPKVVKRLESEKTDVDVRLEEQSRLDNERRDREFHSQLAPIDDALRMYLNVPESRWHIGRYEMKPIDPSELVDDPVFAPKEEKNEENATFLEENDENILSSQKKAVSLHDFSRRVLDGEQSDAQVLRRKEIE